MARQLNAGEVLRKDLFLIDPEQVVCEDNFNGRFEPHDKPAIDEMADSLISDGQLQPVRVRMIADKKVELIQGFRRRVGMIEANKRLLKEGKPLLKLACTVVEANPEEAFVQNIIENRVRRDTTVIDDVHNQRKLRESHGWTEERIAKLYNCTTANLGMIKPLLRLPTEIQLQVHRGELTAKAALQLVELKPEQQKETLAAAEADTKAAEPEKPAETNGTPAKTKKAKPNRISTAAVTRRVREVQLASGGKGPSRTLKEIRVFLEELTGPAEVEGVKLLSAKFLAWMAGELTNKQLENAFKKSCVEKVA